MGSSSVVVSAATSIVRSLTHLGVGANCDAIKIIIFPILFVSSEIDEGRSEPVGGPPTGGTGGVIPVHSSVVNTFSSIIPASGGYSQLFL